MIVAVVFVAVVAFVEIAAAGLVLKMILMAFN